MKAFVKDRGWDFTTKYFQYNDTKSNAWTYITGLEFDLLDVILQQMNMSFSLVLSPKSFEMNRENVNNIIGAMVKKKSDIVLGGLGKKFVEGIIFRFHKSLIYDESQLVCTVFCQISKMEQHL